MLQTKAAPSMGMFGLGSKPVANYQEDRLREIVNRFSVYYEVWPESAALRDHTIRDVGFRLDLCGRHAADSHPLPGCDLCKEIYRGLREIAAWIMPKERRNSFYEVEEFDASIHYGKKVRDPGCVQLEIGILHRSGFDGAVDACEVRCLGEMEDRLKQLGACSGRR